MFWDALQHIGLITSFLYLYLEFKQKTLMWVVSAACSGIYASIYAHAKIYGDMGFSLFNICMCVYGFVRWWQLHRNMQVVGDASNPSSLKVASDASSDNNASTPKEKKSQDIVYTHFKPLQFVKVLGATVLIYYAIYLLLKYVTDSPVPAMDSFTTTLNIVGTWVLAQKIIEVWGIWFLVNLFSIYLYCQRGLNYSTIALYGFYLVASVYGYWKWWKHGVRVDAV